MTVHSFQKHLFCALAFASLATPVCAQSEEVAPHTPTPIIESSPDEIDAKVIRLKSVFTETAVMVKLFVAHKERYKNNPQKLSEELSRISSTYLEPLRKNPEMGKKLTPAQEAAAVNALRKNPECGEYADKVKKLWDETSRTMPLSPKFVARTIAPDVEALLNRPSNEENEEEEPTGSYALGIMVGSGAILIIAALLALHVVSRKRKEQEEKEKLLQLQREAEARRKAEEEAAAAEAALPVLEKVQNANDYRMEPCIFSNDLDKNLRALTTPTRKEVKESYELHVMQGNGLSTQRFAMTKAIISFGRKSDNASGHADIALEPRDMKLSRIHCVFLYKNKDEENTDESFWLLAINQGSDRVRENPEADGESASSEKIRTATLTRHGESQNGTAFVVHPGDVIDLTPSTSITIEKKN